MIRCFRKNTCNYTCNKSLQVKINQIRSFRKHKQIGAIQQEGVPRGNDGAEGLNSVGKEGRHTEPVWAEDFGEQGTMHWKCRQKNATKSEPRISIVAQQNFWL